ncbi:S1 family peptidase [Psychrobacter sp. TWP2-1-2]|uniref:S1 family peptidase n=1 Tax=Psychrobacter sp. TWP2-1-2 TaxID=2804623 RepID=UPI003CFA59CA
MIKSNIPYQISISILTACFSINLAYAATNDERSSTVVNEYSKVYNVSKEESKRRLDIMANYNDIEQKLIAEFGDDIAGVYFDSTSAELKLYIRTTKKGKVVKEVKKFAQNIEIPVEVIPNSPRNAQSIKNIIENQGARLRQSVKGVQSIGYNPEIDAITIYIYETDLNRREQLANTQQLKKISGMETELVFLDSPIDILSLKGGAQISKVVNAGGTSYGNCTAGFPAINAAGKSGLVTAAHCGLPSSPIGTTFVYIGKDNERANMTMTTYNRNATTHDMAFITPDSSGTLVSNGYYADSVGSVEPVTPPVQSAVGMFVCHQGFTTGLSCGTISQVSILNDTNAKRGCPAQQNNLVVDCAATFVAVKPRSGYQLKNEEGDSGGPVFGSVPYGIVSSGNNQVLIFSQLKYLSELGVQLKYN